MLRKLLLIPLLIFTSATCAWSEGLTGSSAADVVGLAAVAPLEHPQPPAKLIVDAPLAGPLRKGAVLFNTGRRICASNRFSVLKRSRSHRVSAIFMSSWMTIPGTGRMPAASR